MLFDWICRIFSLFLWFFTVSISLGVVWSQVLLINSKQSNPEIKAEEVGQKAVIRLFDKLLEICESYYAISLFE